jgi:hypothetical protein
MAKINGHGGFIVKEGSPNLRVDNSEYEVDVEVMIDDTTDSGSGGAAEGLACIYKVNSVTFSVAEDDTNYPFALGITEGQVLSLYLKRGALAQWDYVHNTIVKSSRVSNPQDKARRVSITFEYGRLTRNVPAPAGFGA